MKKKNKALASVVLAASIFLTSHSCGRTINKNDSETIKSSVSVEDTFIPEPTEPQIEVIEEVKCEEAQPIDNNINNYSNDENNQEDVIEETNAYNFAYLSNDTDVYTEMGARIDFIERYQKVLIIDNYGTYSLIEYVNNYNEVKTGYVYTSLLNDLPNTFIEIDISDQTINMYIDGENVLSSVVVTGMNDVTPTNIGYFDIYYKELNATLRGYYSDGSLRYVSFVDYWMPFDGGIGLHDAEYHTDSNGYSHGWRSADSFGGQTYTYNGSHGCVNLLHDTAEFIYENSEIGTKVLVHK